MKAVRRQDLINLIAGYYREFLDPEHKSINDIIKGYGDIEIYIDSIFISIVDCRGLFSNDDVKKVIMTEFAKNLEAVTFGNLKVIRVACNKTSGIMWIEIANAYEVIE